MSDKTTKQNAPKPAKKTAGAFDIRNIIGSLLGIYGVILLLAGLFADPELEKTGGGQRQPLDRHRAPPGGRGLPRLGQGQADRRPRRGREGRRRPDPTGTPPQGQAAATEPHRTSPRVAVVAATVSSVVCLGLPGRCSLIKPESS